MPDLSSPSAQLDETMKRPAASVMNGQSWQRTLLSEITGERGKLLIVFFLPILLHFPELIGIYNADPLGYVGKVGTSIQNATLGRPTIDPNIGFTSDALGRRAAFDWLAGKVPWWNPFEGVGLPLAGEMQSAAFFPLVLLLALGNGMLLFHMTLQIIAGLATYYFLRQMQITPAFSVVGAALFEVNGTFAWLDNAAANPIAFLPLLLLGIERAWEAARVGKAFGWRWIVVGVALSLLAGFPETAYIDILLAGAWIILRLCQSTTWDIRRRFIIRISIGFLLGLFIAAPLVVAFVDYLPLANTGAHVGIFATAFLDRSIILQMFYPYVYGNISQYNQFGNVWANVGGYTSASLFFLALVSLWGKRDRALRWMLMGWIFITWGKSYGFGPITFFVNLLPLVKAADIYRYAPPSWDFAIVILAILALTDLRQRSVTRRQIIVSGAIAAVITLAVPLYFARHVIRKLDHFQHELLAISILIEWAIIVAIIGWYCFEKPLRWRPMIAASLITVVMLTYFSIPMLANPTKVTENLQGVAYLQSHLGLQRYFSTELIAPNYGSAFGIAAINYNDLPIATKWIDYIHKHLDANADPISYYYNGNAPASLIYDVTAYEAVGIKYIVANSGQNPFLYTESPPILVDTTPTLLLKGQVLRGTVPATTNSNQEITQIDIPLTSQDGGNIQVQICQKTHCVIGTSTLLMATTAQISVSVQFAQPLQLDAIDTPLTYQLSYQGNTQVGVAIHKTDTLHEQDMVVAGKAVSGGISLMVYYAPTASTLQQPVYQDSLMSIYELPKPAPFYEAQSGSCQLQSISLEAVTANCTTTGTLIRRSMAMPGWSVTVNGQKVPVSEYQAIFQQITLPVGVSHIQFTFIPPYETFALLACGIALVLFISSFIADSRRRRSLQAKT